jgi:hypothetical protein
MRTLKLITIESLKLAVPASILTLLLSYFIDTYTGAWTTELLKWFISLFFVNMIFEYIRFRQKSKIQESKLDPDIKSL